MFKKEFIPLVIFALLVLWVTGSWGASFLEKDDEPDTVAASESEASSVSTIPTLTDTPTRSPSPTSTPTLSPTGTATPTLRPSPTVTPTPSPSNTLAPKPTQNPLAGVMITNSTMRADANETSSVVGTAYTGEAFNILPPNQNGEWIKINIGDEKIGWVRTKNVETNEVISSVTPSAPPTSDTVPAFLISGNDEDITERSVIDQLESGQQRWYTFNVADQNTDRNITLLVKPITGKVTFAIYTERQYELYKDTDINSVSAEEIGQVDTSVERDWINWNGNLTRGSKYFFRIVNNDQQAIEYCLLPAHTESWDECP